MTKHAVILVGGRGTRLKARLGDLPKPLVTVAGKPLLEHQIDLLSQFGFQITLLMGYRAEKIVSFLNDRYGTDHDITCIEEKAPRGTAGAVLDVLPRLPGTILVMYGDTMLNVDLDKFLLCHKQKSCDATLFLHPNDHPEDSDIVEVDLNGRVTAFHSYPHDSSRYYPNLVNAALYFIETNSIAKYSHLEGEVDFAKKLFPIMLSQGKSFNGYISAEYIKDVGTPKRIDQVDRHWKEGIIEKSSLDVASSAVFLDRDGTLNVDSGHIKSLDEFQLIEGVSFAIRKLNQSGFPVVLVTNQPVIARGDCDESTVADIHQKLDTLIGREGAYIDRKYYCPHHPHGGYVGERAELKIVCSCRKPAPGMLEQASKEMNIELSSSWIIGDSVADIEAGQRAGTRTMCIRSWGKETEHETVRADYEFFDLSSAVNFLVDDFPGMLDFANSLARNVKAGDRIVIAGLSRSGKSTWASIFRESLSNLGLRTVVVRLDDWLLGGKEKTLNGVLSRYDTTAIEAFLTGLMSINDVLDVDIPFYDRQTRTSMPRREPVRIHKSDVVIVDGVIGLTFQKEYFDHHMYVCSEEIARWELFKTEYKLRGHSTEKIEQLYDSRTQDETPVVAKSRHNATIELSGVNS